MSLVLKNYSDKILNYINFKIAKNENLVILGSNGAGKSTLAKVLCGITYSKELMVDGVELYKLSAKERSEKINYIPPKLEIFDEYITVKDFLQLSKLYGEVSVDEAIKLLDLTILADATCKILSSGEQQRLLLASALLHGAKRTIYDEPTANLDPNRTVEVYNLLKSNKTNSKVIITHDLTLAYRLGYRVIYMENGEITFDDESRLFFKESNLKTLFGESLKKVDNNFVVNYI